ncbi:MAG: alpha/beta hydrolase [Actinomycetota bacterium]
MKQALMLFATLALAAFSGTAADAQLPREAFPLWPQGAPGALGKEDKDIPTLTPFFANPAIATGAAVVVLPGGGYGGLAPHEGRDYAMWLNELGISAFVLKYRLGSGGYRHPAMINDASRAIRMVRSKAAEWKLDARRVAIMGSSAGGHLASTALTHFDSGDPSSADPIDRLSSRPDAGILCYPVITLGEKTHQGSKRNLLGENPSPDLVKLLSNELQVTKETPPTFLIHTAEDTAVPVENSLLFADALAKNKVPFALHVYPKGPHGIGLGTRSWDPAARHPWVAQCALWLKELGFAK